MAAERERERGRNQPRDLPPGWSRSRANPAKATTLPAGRRKFRSPDIVVVNRSRERLPKLPNESPEQVPRTRYTAAQRGEDERRGSECLPFGEKVPGKFASFRPRPGRRSRRRLRRIDSSKGNSYPLTGRNSLRGEIPSRAARGGPKSVCVCVCSEKQRTHACGKIDTRSTLSTGSETMRRGVSALPPKLMPVPGNNLSAVPWYIMVHDHRSLTNGRASCRDLAVSPRFSLLSRPLRGEFRRGMRRARQRARVHIDAMFFSQRLVTSFLSRILSVINAELG